MSHIQTRSVVEAMKQALGALKIAQNNLALSRGSVRAYGDGELWDKYADAITTLRTAIEAAEKLEPVAWRWIPAPYWKRWVYSDDGERVAEAKRFMEDGGVQPLYTTPPNVATPLAAPVQDIYNATSDPRLMNDTNAPSLTTTMAYLERLVSPETYKRIFGIFDSAYVQEPVAHEELTDSQIMASVGRCNAGISESRPIGQQWEQVCVLVRHVMRERGYTAPPAAPVQEPVGWIEHHKGGDNLEWDNPGGKCTPLYTTPPAAQRQWVGLMQGVRVVDDSVIVVTKNNDTARQLCAELLREKNSA